MFLENIHNFRTVAIIGIVGAHSLHNFDWQGLELEFKALDTLFNQSSIWFFFIAGFLFQHLSDRYETKKYYISKLKNVICPYIVLSIPAIYASMSFVKQDVPDGFYDKAIIEQILLFLVTGKHLAPFWFVPTISIIYAFSPLLIKADRAKWPYLFVFPLLVLSAYLGRDGILILTNWGGYFSPISKAIYLFSIYFLGMLCSRYKSNILQTLPSFHWLLLLLSLSAFAVNVIGVDNFFHYIFIFKACTSVLFVYYLEVLGRAPLKKIQYVGAASFGIFFIHGYFLQIVKWINEYRGAEATFSANIILFLLFAALITVISCISLKVAQKVLGKKSRLVVGA